MDEKYQTSIRLSAEAKMLIDELAKTFGINQTAVMEQAVRRWARQENVTVSDDMRARHGTPSAALIEERDILTTSSQLLNDYWAGFKECLEQGGHSLRANKPQQYRSLAWVRFPTGRIGIHLTAHIRLNEGLIGVDLTLDRKAKKYFPALEAQKDAIEEEVGQELEWHPRPDKGESWILARRPANLADREDWRAQHEWLRGTLVSFRKAFAPRLKGLKG